MTTTHYDENDRLALEQSVPEPHRAIESGEYDAMDGFARFRLVYSSLLRHWGRPLPATTLLDPLGAESQVPGDLLDTFVSGAGDALPSMHRITLRILASHGSRSADWRSKVAASGDRGHATAARFDDSVRDAVARAQERVVKAVPYFLETVGRACTAPDGSAPDPVVLASTAMQGAFVTAEFSRECHQSASTLTMELVGCEFILMQHVVEDRVRSSGS